MLTICHPRNLPCAGGEKTYIFDAQARRTVLLIIAAAILFGSAAALAAARSAAKAPVPVRAGAPRNGRK
jgi:uncharacterized protein YraI